MEKLYTLYEAAAIMRCCYQTIYRRIKAGQLRAIKNGRKIYVPESAIESYCRRNETMPEPETEKEDGKK